MKIYGTAKGGALSKKDFGVAFGGGGGDCCGDCPLIQEQTNMDGAEGYTDVSYTSELFEEGNVNIGKTIRTVAIRLQKTLNSNNTACTSCTLSGTVIVSFEGSASTSCGSLAGADFCGSGTATGCSGDWFTFDNDGECFSHTIEAGDYLQVYWNHVFPINQYLTTFRSGTQVIDDETFRYSSNGSAWTDREKNMALKLYG